jgi:chaperone modulatory protein CbpM
MLVHDNLELLATELDDAGLTIAQLSTICRVEQQWVIQHIEEGLLVPLPQITDEWRFSSRIVARVRRIVVLEQNFEAVPELAALVADMQEEIAELRQRLRYAGLE